MNISNITKFYVFIALIFCHTTPLYAESLSTGAEDAVKIGVCHNILYEGKGKLIFVSKNALEGHLNHGDTTRYEVLGDGSTCKKIGDKEKPSGDKTQKE